MASVRDVVNGWRFGWRRSWSRVQPAQARRAMRNLLQRPPTRFPRRLVSIGLTNRCQGTCEWCATAGSRTDAAGELSTDEVVDLLTQIAASRYVFNNVSFLGGECLLRPDIHEIVRTATELGLFTHLSTNGLLLDDPCVDELVAAGLNSVFIAHPTGKPRTPREDSLRARVLEGAGRCIARGLPCFLSVCVCRRDVFSGTLESILQMARSMGAAGVRFMPVRLAGKWLRHDDGDSLDEGAMARLRALCRDGFGCITDDAARSAGRVCGAASGRIAYVTPYGEVLPCHFFPFGFGNLRQGRLDPILHRMWRHELVRVQCGDCLLHDAGYRARHILTLDPGAALPVRV